MSYTRRGSIHPDQQHRIGIRTKDPEGDLNANERNDVLWVVERARRILPQVLVEVTHAAGGQGRPAVLWLLNTFFLGPDQGQMRQIAATLVQIINGISLHHRLKIHIIPDSPVDNPNRAVNALGYVRHFNNPARPKGSINLHRELFATGHRDLALSTYIHEASHKYADTQDCSGGQWDETKETAGYRRDSAGKLTTAGAIINADSYGWFCVAVAGALRL